MKRVILDTNIYGRIIERREEETAISLMQSRHDVLIYGFDVIRKEIRQTPKMALVSGRNLRTVLLRLYDSIVATRFYFTTSAVGQIAEDYYVAYRNLGGKCDKKEIINDFLIVACASIHELDLVASDDDRTLKDGFSTKACKIVNDLKMYRTPQFYSYEVAQNFSSLDNFSPELVTCFIQITESHLQTEHINSLSDQARIGGAA